MSDIQIVLDLAQRRDTSTVVKRELREFITFLKRPRRGTGKRAKGWVWLARALSYWLLLLLMYLPIGLALAWGESQLQLRNEIDLTSLTMGTFLSLALIGPVIEELLFRAGLRSASYCLFFGPVVITLVLGLGQSVGIVVFLVLAVTCMCQWLVHLQINAINEVTRVRFSRRFLTLYPAIFWIYTLGFALMHIKNYSIDNPAAAVAIALFQIPQLLAGITLGYLRLRDGLQSSVFLHCLNNATAGLLVMYLPQCEGWARGLCK